LFVFFLLHVNCREQGLPMCISGSGIEFITLRLYVIWGYM